MLSPPASASCSASAHSGSCGTSVSNNQTKHPPYWNDDPRAHWLGPLNVGYAIIDRRREQVLINSGVWSNAMAPAYIKQHKMKVWPVHDLTMYPTSIPISSIGGHTAALGYVIINVQVEGIPSYYEEQVALVIPNVTQLGMKVPVILGTPTIHRLCHQMKESEIQTGLEEWQHALLSYEASRNVSIHPMTPQLDQDSNVE